MVRGRGEAYVEWARFRRGGSRGLAVGCSPGRTGPGRAGPDRAGPVQSGPIQSGGGTGHAWLGLGWAKHEQKGGTAVKDCLPVAVTEGIRASTWISGAHPVRRPAGESKTRNPSQNHGEGIATDSTRTPRKVLSRHGEVLGQLWKQKNRG
jgi:hypothetical protein